MSKSPNTTAPASNPVTPLQVEQAALNAWPALESRTLGNWWLRAAGGYTKRANGVTVLGPPDRPLAEAIAEVERWYTSHRLPPLYRLPSFVPDDGLPALLAEDGFAPLDRTRVLCRDLPSSAEAPSPPEIEIVDVRAWLDARALVRGGRTPAAHEQMLQGIQTPLGCALLRENGRTIALGMGVVDGTLLGLFDLFTPPPLRRRGIGTRFLEGLLDWGRQEGARTAYLQVMESNEGARGMYERMGFEALYSYHYMMPPPSSF